MYSPVRIFKLVILLIKIKKKIGYSFIYIFLDLSCDFSDLEIDLVFTKFEDQGLAPTATGEGVADKDKIEEDISEPISILSPPLTSDEFAK